MNKKFIVGLVGLITASVVLAQSTRTGPQILQESLRGSYDKDAKFTVNIGGEPIIEKSGATNTLVAGKVYYFASVGGTQQLILADADVSACANARIGIAIGTSASTHGVLVDGRYTVTDTALLAALTPGASIYLSATAGSLTTVAPTGASQVVRKVGVALPPATLGAAVTVIDIDQAYGAPDGSQIKGLPITVTVTPQFPSAVTPTITVTPQFPSAVTPTITVDVTPQFPSAVTPTIVVSFLTTPAYDSTGAAVTNESGAVYFVTNVTATCSELPLFITNATAAGSSSELPVFITNATAASSALPVFITNASATATNP